MAENKEIEFLQRIAKLASCCNEEVSDQFNLGDGSDFSTILSAIKQAQVVDCKCPSILLRLILDPPSATAAIAMAWFEFGLLYAREYGVPADISRLYSKIPLEL